ncbi:MAG: T9SS type A sorting domain-containing protein [Candidatus Marinimicrobia bacterium]|jgi:spore coat protein CotH|nr:T9SS type A sorting domain-containing protein [Candidatus Neomarinimicrobiota bacterium]MBT4946359.1 T9SS type A sorting domain-containing protein [Candidatus Neomarinimicrobiota bacterium]
MKITIKLLLLLPLILTANDLDLLYDDSQVAIIEVTMEPEGLIWMYDHVQSDSMHLSTVHFSNAFIDETIENVGFRLRGNTSRNAQKKSFKISFNTFEPGRKFYDVEKLNLNGEHNDPSIMRSKIAWDHYQKNGMATTRAAHCAVYINDVYYGLYISIEHIDEEFLKNHFEDDSGNLWKCLWPADLTYRGPNASDYHPYQDESRPYELKTNEDLYDYSELARLITVLHETPSALFPDSLEQVLVVPDVLKYAAMNILMGNWDDYWFLRNNYYLYHDPSLERIRFIPYDYDNSFSIDWFNVDWTQVNPYSFMTIEESQGNSPGSRPLMEEIMGNTQYRNLYTHILEYYQDNITDLSLWESHLDNLRDMITPWAELDSFRTLDYGFSIPDFHQSFSHNPYANQHVKKGLKQFVNERHASLDNQLVYETAPPIIYDLQYWPLIPGPDDSIYVSVAAFSDVGIDSLTIAYHPGVLTVVMSYPMHFAPLENPESIEEADRWVGVIPPLGEMGHGRFQVGAVDLNGQSMLYPRSNFEYIQVPGSSLNPLRINEFLADNVTVNPDGAGEYDDWLELYNTGSSPIYLGGMYLTDDATNLTKWMFPFGGVALESGGYLLVWCDEDQEQSDLHCNFKLSRHGEFLALVDTDGLTIIDALNFGPQQQDVSYGRSPDGGMDWVNFDNPSPGASNETVDLIGTQVLPENFYLNNYPNPFNAETILRYKIPERGMMQLVILDLNGRETKKLVEGVQSSGEYSIAWKGLDESGSNVSAGIYFVKLVQGNFTTTHKILLLK